MQGVFNGPVPTHGAGKGSGIGRDAGQEETHFASADPLDLSQTLDHAETAQAIPKCAVSKPTDFLGDPIAPGLDAAMVFFHRFQEIVRCSGEPMVFGIQEEAADFFERGLRIAFEGQNIVGVSVSDLAGDFLLGARGIDGDNAVRQIQGPQ